MQRLFIILALSLCTPLLAAASPHAKSLDQLISVDFSNERRFVVLENVADFYGLKLVVPDAFSRESKVSEFKIRDLSRAEIFDLTLAGTGFTYVEKEGVVEIVTGSTDVRAISILQRKLYEQIESDSKEGAVLYKLLKIEDQGQLERTRKKLWAIVSTGHWEAGDLLKAMEEDGPNKTSEPTATNPPPPATSPAPLAHR